MCRDWRNYSLRDWHGFVTHSLRPLRPQPQPLFFSTVFLPPSHTPPLSTNVLSFCSRLCKLRHSFYMCSSQTNVTFNLVNIVLVDVHQPSHGWSFFFSFYTLAPLIHLWQRTRNVLLTELGTAVHQQLLNAVSQIFLRFSHNVYDTHPELIAVPSGSRSLSFLVLNCTRLTKW